MMRLPGQRTGDVYQLRRGVGSYGTRNVVEVIESWFWERLTDCLVLSLFKFYSSGDPFFLGHSPSPAFSAVV